MIHSQEDIKDFKVQINELQINLIRERKSPHNNLAFMVSKHNEIKRGKTRMVIN